MKKKYSMVETCKKCGKEVNLGLELFRRGVCNRCYQKFFYSRLPLSTIEINRILLALKDRKKRTLNKEEYEQIIKKFKNLRERHIHKAHNDKGLK